MDPVGLSDFVVSDHGTIFLLQPLSPAASQWVEDQFQLESWHWHGNSIAIEHRFIRDIVEGIRSDNLSVFCS